MRSIKTMLLIVFAFTGILLSANEFDWFTQAAEIRRLTVRIPPEKSVFPLMKMKKPCGLTLYSPKGEITGSTPI